MKLHRFYLSPETELRQDFWVHDQQLLWQWNKVLRFRADQEVVLFDGDMHDRLYKITEITDREAHVHMITQLERKLPSKNIYLFWALLKKDKNDWVLQKCTELGVSHFVPLLADRSEKTGFNEERAKKILVEAAEQCGRSDIPTVREPMHIVSVFDEFTGSMPLYICEQDGIDGLDVDITEAGVLIGPEGGWSDAEKELFKARDIKHLNLHDFTLRAETACVTAATKLIQ